MANLSFRMLYFCLFAAILLNASNYTFMKLYNPNGKIISKYYYPKTSSGVESERALITSQETSQSFSTNSIGEMSTTNDPRQIIIYKNKSVKATAINDGNGEVTSCPEFPPGLGDGTSPFKVLDEKEFDAKYSDVEMGGIYQPLTCRSRHSVAVIVAYRGCKKYLKVFLQILHPFLIQQQLDYQIFVLEQSNNSQHFNRGMLLNVGFVEAQKRRKDGWNCILFHEAHIVPIDTRNLYRCGWYPRQLAVHVERPVLGSYVPKFGGAVAMTPEQFSKVNGFSNRYWGNDADFEDLYYRVLNANYFIENSLPALGKYKTLEKHTGPRRIKSEYIATISPLYLLDGLTSLSYTMELDEATRLYTYIKVNINEANDTESSKLFDKLLKSTSTKTIQIKATTVTHNVQMSK